MKNKWVEIEVREREEKNDGRAFQARIIFQSGKTCRIFL
jgi:hypothetical protein